ncbi:DUF1292 domain-containing protein [Marinicrinis lubricantis]|uniref:DUF1292 domain-containing protein n=1 Tax=Marinicrinis lubricantis TaxID=2086470 RepID=A0ABW1IW29_9BACL
MRTWYSLEDAELVTLLRDAYGTQIELEGAGEGIYSILAEFALHHQYYAIVQNASMKKEGDIEVIRYYPSQNQEFELENVEDDEEWENISEIYDEFMYNKLADSSKDQDE